MKRMLEHRNELQNLTSINRVFQKKEKEQLALIGIVTDKQKTKTGKIVISLEDLTGTIKVMVSPNSKEAFAVASDVVLDEVLGVVGSGSGEVIFANSLIAPDVPLYKELKKSPDETYALFMGDFHFGSKVFLKDSFEKFMSWISGDYGGEKQKEIVSKIKYIFMVGDLVDGVGIYPNQEAELEINDIYAQYVTFAKQLARIPENIRIIICPGNHDAMRIAEPQPPLYKDFAKPVWELPNVTMVSNPAVVNIHSSGAFPGFDVLLYHGFSFTYYADAVDSIRSQGGQERVDLIMQFLLQRRHLAPTHKSTLYLPDAKKDSLVIERIPDFFATGHIHRVAASNYRNITLLSCSCWLETTEYQEKLGLHPQPGRVLMVNLQSRKVKIIKFFDEDKQKNDKPKEVKEVN
jgi:DNA polymerase II small subunit